MLLEDYDFLYRLLEEFRQEAEAIESQMACNQRIIREADAHLENIKNLEPEDVKVFTPRRAEIIYKEEINRIKLEKSVCEERNQSLTSQKSVLDRRIENLSDILNRQKQDLTSQISGRQDFRNISIDSMKEVIQKIYYCTTRIERNPIQAKQDFVMIARHLEDIVDNMRNL